MFLVSTSVKLDTNLQHGNNMPNLRRLAVFSPGSWTSGQWDFGEWGSDL